MNMTKKDPFTTARTYESDLPLFHKLGFAPFEIDVHHEHFIGEVKDDDGSYIKVWVRCMPAQIFRFEIFDAQSLKKYRVITGSGTLEEYWPMAKSLMDNMFVVEEVINV